MVGPSPGSDGRSNVRWTMIILVLVVAAVSFLDRTNISIAGIYLKSDLSLSDVQLGMVFSAFGLGYALAQPLAGWIADRFGVYRTMAIGILWWSALTAIVAAIPTKIFVAFAILLSVRFILGIGESLIFPASNRMVVNWMPSQERGLANGLIFAGVGVGAGIAPPLVTTIMLEHGWRASFWACAIIGLMVLVAWLLIAREHPNQHPGANFAERTYIEEGSNAPAGATGGRIPWRAIIFDRRIALLTSSYFCFGYGAYMFFSWFFIYLSNVRGLDLKSSGLYGMLPFIAMAITSPLGGWLSDRLSVRFGPRVGRCLVAASAMGLASIFVAVATQVADARLAAVVLAGGSGVLYLAQSAFWTLSAELGQASAGSVSGVMNMGCQIGGTVVASLTPIIARAYGWSASILVAAAIVLAGAIALLFIEPPPSPSRYASR